MSNKEITQFANPVSPLVTTYIGSTRVNPVLWEPTTKDYIQDGLIAHWDGIENVERGGGHNSSSTVWKDLTDNGYDLNLTSKASFGDNCLISQNAKATAVGTKYLPNYYTIEIVLKPVKQENMVVFIPQNSSSVRLFVICFDNNIMNFQVKTGMHWYKTNRAIGQICSCAATYVNDNPANYYANGITAIDSGKWANWSARSITGITISDSNTFYYKGNIYSIRTYDRALSRAEIAHNYAIDKIRFGL